MAWIGGSLLFASVMFQSCEKDILTGQPEWLGNSIYERLEEGIVVNDTLRHFTIVMRLIDDLGQKEILSRTGSKTLFVASDEAYTNWFKNNSWGITSYEQLSLAQKKLLLNNSMINNAYLIELMSNVSGNPPQEGLCMRRPTASSIYDSVPTMSVSEMPINPMQKERLDSWSAVRNGGKDIHILKNSDAAPMIHFLPEFMAKNKITDRDLQILSNGESNSIADSWINGKKVISDEQTCKNGYIYVVSDVIESNPNMAEIIRTEKEMSTWSHLLSRFSTPRLASNNIQNEYRRLYNTNDTVYELRYFSKSSLGAGQLQRTERGNYPVPAMLSFDPGLNQYMWTNTMGYDMHYDAGAMIVPTDEALENWKKNEGKGLWEEYGSWDSIPALTISKLLNVNMLTSFVDAVPSKFETIVDDAKVTLGIEESHIVKCYMGCNGVVYLVNKVFSPAEYRSVVYPALAHQSLMGAIYHAISDYGFGSYLNSMDSPFSLILPYNDQVLDYGDVPYKCFQYLDPCTYGQSTMDLYEFFYDEDNEVINALLFTCELNEFGQPIALNYVPNIVSQSLIKNRLEDLVDNLIVVGDSTRKEGFNEGQEYYKTKAGSIIRVTGSGNNMKIQGGFQMEHNIELEAEERYDMTNSGNGASYGMKGNNLVMTSTQSVYQILKEHAEAGGDSLFFKLLKEDDTEKGILSPTTGTSIKYNCLDAEHNYNISLFDHYNYTVYIPSDEAIQRLIDQGYLPTWNDWKTYQLEDESDDRHYSDEEIKRAEKNQKTIAEIIHNFVRYHIQDNSVYINGEPVLTPTKYESAKLNPNNKRFYSLTVTADSQNMTVTDQTGATYKVVKDKGLYNRTSREYWISGSGHTMLIESSSNAVLQQIDGALIYDKETQMVPWKNQIE